MQTMPPLVLTDCRMAAVTLLNNVRVPAALLAGASLAQSLTLEKMDDEALKKSRVWTLYRFIYVALLAWTFTANMSAIFIATHVGVRITAGSSFSPMATSAVALMLRDFELEFVWVRAAFATGLLSYLTAITMQLSFMFRKSADFARALAFGMGSVVLTLLSYNNAHTIAYGGLTGLVRRWVVLIFEMLFERMTIFPFRPMPFLAMLSTIASAYFLLRGAMAIYIAAADKDKDGTVSWDETSTYFRELISEVTQTVRGHKQD